MLPIHSRSPGGPVSQGIALQDLPGSVAGAGASSTAVTDLPRHGTAAGAQFQIGRLLTSLGGRATELLHACLDPAHLTQLSLPAPGLTGQSRCLINTGALSGVSPGHDLPAQLRLTSAFDEAMNLTHVRLTNADEADTRVFCEARFEPRAQPAQQGGGVPTAAARGTDLQAGERRPRPSLLSQLCCFSGAGSEPNSPTRVAPTGTASFIDNTAHLNKPTPGLGLFLNHMGAMDPGYFSQERQVVDLGAGGGRDTRTLLKHPCQVTAVDPDPKMPQKLAASRGEQLKTVTGTLADARLAAQSQDLVNVQRVLPFIHGPELEHTLQEIARVLKPGGYLSASVFGPDHTWNNPSHPMSAKVEFNSEAQMRDMLKRAGFEVQASKASNHQETAGSGEVVPHWNEIRFVAKKASPAIGASSA